MPEVGVAKWANVLEHLAKSLPQSSFEVWFRNQGISALSWDERRLELGVPNRFVKEWLRTHYSREIGRAAAEVMGLESPPDIEFTITGAQYAKRRSEESATLVAEAVAVAPACDRGIRLNPDLTLENFVAGPCNRMAHAACRTVVESPSPVYNPVCIYGASGLGKTHLLQAICHGLHSSRPGARILYLSCEEFTNSYIRAIQAKRLDEFRARFRNCDCLAVDDVQFLGTREKTCEEFLHTFDTLRNANRQVAVTCDAHPREIGSLGEKLITRLVSGLVVRLDPPGVETRRALVEQKALRRGLSLPEDVLDSIAARVGGNVREVEGVVAKLAALSMAEGRAPDMAMCREAMRDMGLVRDGAVSQEEILRLVESEFGVSGAEIRSGGRRPRAAAARHAAMYLARRLTGFSLAEIGDFYGGRDHSTVHHAERRAAELMRKNPEFKAAVERLLKALGG
ncbi:MAG: chromosomal replication initiator protein DnaA [Planctomycetota bacterium]|nr:chromosomal replication initiator protein DnaA [Planctomycetota bacterium]